MWIMAQMLRVRAASQGWNGGPGLSTWYFVDSSDPTSTDTGLALAAVESVQTGLSGAVGIFPTTWSIQVSNVVDVLDPANGDLTGSYTVDAQDALVGTGGSAFGPIECMLVGRLLTDDIVNGHRVSGRQFIGPTIPGTDANGSPNSTLLTAGHNLAVYNAGGTGGAPEQVVWSRPVEADSTHVPPIAGRSGSHHKVTGASVADKWGVLRSRRD